MKHKRTALVKAYTTDETKELLQRACTAMGKSVSDVLNECTIIIGRDYLAAKPKQNNNPPFGSAARPKPQESKVHFSGRPCFGVVPRIKLRV